MISRELFPPEERVSQPIWTAPAPRRCDVAASPQARKAVSIPEECSPPSAATARETLAPRFEGLGAQREIAGRRTSPMLIPFHHRRNAPQAMWYARASVTQAIPGTPGTPRGPARAALTTHHNHPGDRPGLLHWNAVPDKNRSRDVSRHSYRDHSERIDRHPAPACHTHFLPICAYIRYLGEQSGIPYQPLRPQKILQADHCGFRTPSFPLETSSLIYRRPQHRDFPKSAV